MNLVKIISTIYSKLKHGDEMYLPFDNTKCPSGYECHTHQNYLRNVVHNIHCALVSCPYRR
jgi:hypothetical protein